MSQDRGNEHLPVRYGDARPPAPYDSGQAIAALGELDASVAPLREYLSLLLRRKWTVIVAAAAIFGAACLFTATSARIYEATASLLVREPAGAGASVAFAQGEMPPMMEAMAAPNLETHAALIQGKSTADATAAWLEGHGGPNLSAAAVRRAIRAGIVPKTHLVKVSARARSPEDARRIADAAASAYAEMNRHRARGSSESASRYLTEQLTMAKDNLSTAEDALRTFKESTGTVAQDAAAGELLSRAAALRSDIDRTAADLAQIRVRLGKVRGQLAQQNRSIAAVQVRDNAVVQQLRAKLVDLEGQRLVAQSQYTGSFSAPLDQIDEQIRITRDQLNSEIRNVIRSGGGDLAMQQALVGQLVQGEAEAAALHAREQQSRAGLRVTQEELQRIPARQITLARLDRQVEVAQSIHSDLLKRSQEIEVGRVMALGNTDVVEFAETPLLPIKPNVPLNLTLGLLLGLAVGVGLALLQEQLDDTVREEEDITRFAGAPILGAVPMCTSSAFLGRRPSYTLS